MLQDTTYRNVKGFNYVPSRAGDIWEAIDSFDKETWDREFGYSKRFHANALRIWCDFLSFQKDEKRFLTTWDTVLKLAEKHGLKIMITTANRWVDARWPYGGLDFAVVVRGPVWKEYAEYLKTFVGAFRAHPSVLMWDLCNEPFSALGNDPGLQKLLMDRELAFWRTAVEATRVARPSQPVTIGVMRNAPDEMHDLVDVISCHPYGGWWDDATGFQETLDFYVALANRKGKPLICSETCQGSKNNETRRQIIQVSIRELERRKIGWLAWQLMAGKIVSARWDRFDQNCKPGGEAIMYWVEKDGRTRPGHDEKEWRTW